MSGEISPSTLQSPTPVFHFLSVWGWPTFMQSRGIHFRVEPASFRSGLLFLALLAGVAGCQKAKPPPAAPPEVQVITATLQDVPIFQDWIGTLDGFVNAEIRAQVAGYLQSQEYREGAQVKKGDALFHFYFFFLCYIGREQAGHLRCPLY